MYAEGFDMIRLFVKNRLFMGSVVIPDEKQTHYLKNVMRRSIGDQILLFNGCDGEWSGVISDLNKKQIALVVEYQTRTQKTLPTTILCPALIKKEHMDLVLQKATELGVTRIQPIITRNTVVRQFNRERAYLIVREAAEQCERLCLPQIDNPCYLDDFLANYTEEATLVFLSERGQTSGPCFSWDKVCFVIGPEGGWTPDEIRRLSSVKNSVSCRLGETVLRAETASIATLACRAFLIMGKK